ncbi:hypothetical protein [Phenylobacterium sp.]|uniref:hypothetical protein n=1 Tax=Phenylobacterium sp. TaxID=1871053 RepID=UPI002FCC6B6D
MSPAYDLSIETYGGVRDLSRVVGVLALYELTPAKLAVRGHGAGLRIEVRLETDERASRLCANRMAALPAVAGVTLQPRRSGAKAP